MAFAHRYTVCSLFAFLLMLPAVAEEDIFDTFIKNEQQEFKKIVERETEETLRTGIAVRIINDHGQPVASIKVLLDGSVSRLTDPAGICVFDGPEPGEHTVEIEAWGYEKIKPVKTVHDPDKDRSSPLVLTIKPLPTTAVIRTVDIGGVPLRGVDVQLAGKSRKTDKLGIVRFEDVRLDGGADITFRKLGFSKIQSKARLDPRNWSREVFKNIVLRRLDQFKPQMAYKIGDSPNRPPNNGDGKANAGEHIKIPLVIENTSDEVTDSWALAVRSDSPFIKFEDDAVYKCKPLAARTKKEFYIPVKIKPDVQDLDIAKIKVMIKPLNDPLGETVTEHPLPLYPGRPLDFKLMIEPIIQDPVKGKLSQINNGNNILGPGELGVIKLTVGNQSHAVEDVVFDLQTIPPDLFPVGSVSQRDAEKNVILKSNHMIDRVFTVKVPRGYYEAIIPFVLRAESHGRQWAKKFSIPVEGKTDFHVSMQGRGRLVRGSLCHFNIRLTYSGPEKMMANIILDSLGSSVKTKPDAFRGRILVPDRTLELSGMLIVPAEHVGNAFAIELKIEDMEHQNMTVFSKQFLFELEK